MMPYIAGPHCIILTCMKYKVNKFIFYQHLRGVLEFVFGRKRKKMKGNRKIIVFSSFYQTEKKGNRKDLIGKLRGFLLQNFPPKYGRI